MASINSTLRLQDSMSRPMQSITKAMKSTLTAIRSIEGAELGSAFAQAAADVRLAESSIDQMNNELQNVPQRTEQVGNGFTIMKGLAVSAIASIVNSLKDKLMAGIDKALARIDTMEQFSRTMTALTGSSLTAATALDEVRSSVTGTAYGLDVAARAVQSFVTSGKDIKTSTAQIAALGDAVAFYGDGTNASLESVSAAWAKMATSGKISAQDVRSLTLAGIPVYKIYADAVGKSVGEVQTALSNGKISSSEFQKTLSAALMDGTEHFASIEGAALKAGASWTGTFDNMGAAISRGWVNIITQIDASLAAAGFPQMREMIASLGKAMEGFLGLIASHVDVLVGFAVAIGVVATAYGLWTAATWLSVAANQALVITLLTNPFVWIVVAIATVVAAIYRWIQGVGGIQIAWLIAKDIMLTAWDNIKITFTQVVNAVLTMGDKLKLGITKMGVAINNIVGDMKVGVLTGIENMVNGAIDIINKFIETLSKIPGVNLEAIQHVTFAATAAAENEALKQAGAAEISAAEATLAENMAARAASEAQMQAKRDRDRERRGREIDKMQMKASASTAEGISDIAAGFDDVTTDSGKALKTKSDVKISGEDIKMLLDIATQDYRVIYQTLTPQLSLNVDTIRETVDVDYVTSEIATIIEEAAFARVVTA